MGNTKETFPQTDPLYNGYRKGEAQEGAPPADIF